MPAIRRGRRRILTRILVICPLVLLLLIAADCRLCVRHYTVPTGKISSPIRIALITDLHSCRYGKAQRGLIDAVDAQSPDVILLGGDIFDDVKADTNTALFLAGIAGRYPCYYVTGNHEHWSGEAAFAAKMEILAEYGIPVLSGDCIPLTVNGETINLCGVDDPAAERPDQSFTDQLDAAAKAAESGRYTVLLSHRPEYAETYAQYAFDLVLCGHAHGGQWRIPYLLNGLIAPNQGLFPPYAGGEYPLGNTTMIVSRGLARETTPVPRIFNRPELVMIDLCTAD